MFKFLIRLTSFFRKEIAEVVRQPMLILTLILGPFLILLLFGMGYKTTPNVYRTMFVATENSQLAEELKANISSVSSQLELVGIVQSEEEMLAELRRGTIDLGIVMPRDSYATIRANKQAVFTVYHNQVDPMAVSYIGYISQMVVDEINRRVISKMAEQGQTDAAEVQTNVDSALEMTRSARTALQAGDAAKANQDMRGVRRNLSAVEMAIGASASLLQGVDQTVGSGESQASSEALDTLQSTNENPATSGEIEEGKSDYRQEIDDLNKLEADLTKLQGQLAEFQSISPVIMSRPFTSETKGISDIEYTPMDFFTPAVIILLLQHVMVTLAALSIVRERRSGTMELFRVSPIRAGEVLIGKYLSYLLIGAVIVAALGALMIYGLRSPNLGSWLNVGIVVFLVMFASLGVGFFISLVAGTESQAVQYSMIYLLLSVFFSGFILDLQYLVYPVKVVSWLLPATYGTQLLQNIMLRGGWFIQSHVINLSLIGLAMLLVSWFLMRMRMRNA